MTSANGGRPIRVGLIGAGMIGQMRAGALAQMPGELVLAAVADPRTDLARNIAAGAAKVYEDGHVLAADPEIDAVILSTPPASHESLGVACLEAGKHLLCEKPLAASVQACERLVSLAARRNLRLATGFTVRQTPAAKLARRLVDEGAIGEVDHVRAFHGHKGGSEFGPAWITQYDATGGGTLMDNGIHMIDLARWFMGDIVSATGMGSNHTWKKPGCEDNGFVLMRSANGRIASVQGSWTEWRAYGWRIEIFGTEGFIKFSFPPLWLVHGRRAPGEKLRVKHHPFPKYQIMERLKGWQWSLTQTLIGDLRDWANAIRAGTEPPASGRDGLEAVRIALSIEFAR
jgi:predicted dehydrogenase